MVNIGGEERRVTGGGDTMVLVPINPTLYKLIIEPVFISAFGGVAGAAIGGMVGTIIAAPLARRNPRVLSPLSRTQYAREYARDCSASLAACSGIESIMREIRGNDDLTTRMVSASGGGLAYSFVSNGLKGKRADALSCVAACAVLSGTMYKVQETVRWRNAQYASYTEARAMLVKLGLEEYEKNFNKGHLTDLTLPLLTDSDLKEVDIPPGARLLILDHIKWFEYKLLYSHIDQIYELDPTMICCSGCRNHKMVNLK